MAVWTAWLEDKFNAKEVAELKKRASKNTVKQLVEMFCNLYRHLCDAVHNPRGTDGEEPVIPLLRSYSRDEKIGAQLVCDMMLIRCVPQEELEAAAAKAAAAGAAAPEAAAVEADTAATADAAADEAANFTTKQA